ncbi:MAG: hypothetical protein ACO331_16230 [Prochlorothrix sp.]
MPLRRSASRSSPRSAIGLPRSPVQGAGAPPVGSHAGAGEGDDRGIPAGVFPTYC